MQTKLIEVIFLTLALYFLTGCAQLGNAIYDPVVSHADGSNPQQQLVTTNGWVLNSDVKQGIKVAGELLPVPWASFAANGVIGILAIVGHIRSKKWRAAAISACSAAEEFKTQLVRLDHAAASEAKQKVKTEQKLSGTRSTVQAALRLLGS